MKSIKTTIVVFFSLAAALIAQQKDGYSKEPGYFDFKEFAVTKLAEPTTEVVLEEQMIKMIAGLSNENDKKGDFGDLMGGLKLIKVNEFELGQKDSELISSNIDAMDKSLISKKWDRIVKSKHSTNQSYIYMKSQDPDGVQGLVVIDYNKSGKLTLVNIVGKIDLSNLGKISGKLNIPQLNKMKQKNK